MAKSENGTGRSVRAPKTSELIAAQFRRRIVRGELQPGTLLPSESDLMVQLGVSRPTLREAYRLLEAEALLEIRRGVGGGARVTAPDIAAGARYVGLLLQFEGATISDVYEARTVLEPICAGLMAARRDAEANQSLFTCIARVEALIKGDPRGIPEPAPWSAATYAFHELVLKGSGNKTLSLQGQLLQEVVATHYAVTIASSFEDTERPERFRRVLLSFRKLSNLVSEGDQPAAVAHWTGHMRTAAQTLLGEDVKNMRVVDLFG